MIKTKSDLKLYTSKDREKYSAIISKKAKFRKDFYYKIVQYLNILRKCEYYHNRGGKISLAKYLFLSKKKNKYEEKIQVFIPINTIGYGVMIYHGNIVINSSSKIGNYCSFHGNNCIGNKGQGDLSCPTIGDGVEFGFGSVAVGGIEIADNCIVGSLSFVNKDFLEAGSTIVGVPAFKKR